MPSPDDAPENAQNNYCYAGSYNNGMASYGLEIVRGGNQEIRLTRLDMSFFGIICQDSVYCSGKLPGTQ